MRSGAVMKIILLFWVFLAMTGLVLTASGCLFWVCVEGTRERTDFSRTLFSWSVSAISCDEGVFLEKQTRVLLVVDVQYDFCPGGALAVVTGMDVAHRICGYLESFADCYAVIVFTRDWHHDPGRHFAAQGEEPDFLEIWPPHCVAGTKGAEFSPALLHWTGQAIIVSKGHWSAVYSGFQGTVDISAGRELFLQGFLQESAVGSVDVCGLATDYCVAATEHDAMENGYKVRMLVDLCGGIAADSTARALTRFVKAGGEFVFSEAVA